MGERVYEQERKKAPTALSSAMDKLTFHSASKQIQSTMAFPPMILKKYEKFISTNVCLNQIPLMPLLTFHQASSVSQIESALRSFTYIIPNHQEIATESRLSSLSPLPAKTFHWYVAVHSAVQLLSLYHDTLLSKLPKLTAQSPHTRYTTYWKNRSTLYRRVSLFLQMVKSTELLWEMAARRKGEKRRWRVVILLEVLKACCKFLLVHITKSRPVLDPPLPQRELVPAEQAAEDEEYGDTRKAKEWTMPRTGQNLPALPSSSEVSKFLLLNTLKSDDVRPAAQLLHRINGSAQLSEYLHILRPVLYAIAMSRNPRSWRPWVISLVFELAALRLRKDGLRVTSLEKEEWKNRSRQLLWYMMRGPFYENFTGEFLRGLTSKMKGKIGLDLIAGIIDDYEFLWSNYYFSTST